MSTSQVARRLECSEGAVRAMERRGMLVAERTTSGMRLFDREAVERLVIERLVKVKA
jgi:DNA-binding transcriptional MerR regulator